MLQLEQYDFIIEQLKTTKDRYTTIGKKVPCDYSTVQRVNDGETKFIRDYYTGTFPIRPQKEVDIHGAIKKIKKILSFHEVSFEEVEAAWKEADSVEEGEGFKRGE